MTKVCYMCNGKGQVTAVAFFLGYPHFYHTKEMTCVRCSGEGKISKREISKSDEKFLRRYGVKW